ncbi:translation initiation factor IF-2 N-terminal domain-containing protein, partial [Staphylococcus succinus]|uniref:translation initiation factor IF-2 N-terminal domain-containing protein n=2 Tax=Staphylococcus TaxID=1279 RepID=UPI000CD39885
MSKKRIYEYAKELSIKSKVIIDELKKMNVEVSSHMQALEDDQIKTLDKIYKPEQAKQAEQSQSKTQNNQQSANNKPNNKGNQNHNNSNNNKNNKNNNSNGKNNKNNKKNNKNNKQPKQEEPKEIPSKITYQEGITVGELADKLNVDSSAIIKKLFLLGVMANINQSLDEESLELIVDEYGVE